MDKETRSYKAGTNITTLFATLKGVYNFIIVAQLKVFTLLFIQVVPGGM
jgi:hypothetical protein